MFLAKPVERHPQGGALHEDFCLLVVEGCSAGGKWPPLHISIGVCPENVGAETFRPFPGFEAPDRSFVGVSKKSSGPELRG